MRRMFDEPVSKERAQKLGVSRIMTKALMLLDEGRLAQNRCSWRARTTTLLGHGRVGCPLAIGGRPDNFDLGDGHRTSHGTFSFMASSCARIEMVHCYYC